MAAAIAVPIALGAARLAAQTGVAYAAGKAINYGLNKGIPKLLSKTKNFTAKYKKTRGVSRVIGKIEKGYQSKGGRIVRGAVSAAGSLAAYYVGGKAFDKAGNMIASHAGPTLSRLAKGTHIGRAITGRKPKPVGDFRKKSADWQPPAASKELPPGFPKNRMEARANQLSNYTRDSGVKKDFAPPRRLKTTREIMRSSEKNIFSRPVTAKKK